MVAFFMGLWAISVSASPANPEPFSYQQKDGSVVTLQDFGDDHYHFTKTSDGYMVMGNGDGSYVYVGEDGTPSKFIAKNANKRTDEEDSFLKSLDQSEVQKKHKALNGDRFPETAYPPVAKPKLLLRASSYANSFVKGDRFFPVILLSTADFTGFDSTLFARMFNEEGYSDDGHYGSLKDYFKSSSGGQFNPTFDIYPVKIAKNFGSYDGEGSLIPAALDILVEREDFKARASKYESVIPFIFMHPLSNDAAQTYNDWYYSHQYNLQYSMGRKYSKNGFTFDSYAFVAQKLEYTKDKVNMLGTYAHEFSHVLGLYDLYSADAQGYATIGPNPYDVMALGLRNGNGRYPPTYSAFERESMGWLTINEIEAGDSIYTLKNIAGMQAYSISNPKNNDEYYVVEYRPAVGFDSKMTGSSYSGKTGANGVFVWYVNYDHSVFMTNDPNSDVNNPRVDVKKVLSKAQESFTDLKFSTKAGSANVSGVFNFVFDGNDRVCFTADKSVALSACPEKVAEENPDKETPAAVESSSSTSKPVQVESSADSDSSAEKPSSSSKKTEVDAASSSTVQLSGNLEDAVRAHMNVAGKMLEVNLSAIGVKTLKIFDLMGNVVQSVSFEGPQISVDLQGLARSRVVVRLYNESKLVANRLILVQ